jgi:hypothetical protein
VERPVFLYLILEDDMFEIESFAIGGVSLIALVFGLTEFLKDLLGWEGKKVTALAASLGFLAMAVFEGLKYIQEPYAAIVTGIVASLAFGLAASGFYKYGTRNG